MEKQKINAQIVADSIDSKGNRITTFVLTYPRFIHAEVMTHRVFSRNAASSRAIPFKTMVKSVEEDPFIPIAWQKDHKGMQGVEYFTDDLEKYKRANKWAIACDQAIESAVKLNQLEVTKQLCNRLLEPFLWYTNLVTVTEIEGFYELRCPKYELFSENMPMYFRSRKDFNKYVENIGDSPFELTEEDWWITSKSGAEIHIQALAEAMWDAQNESTPNQLEAGEWHMPFMGNFDPKKLLELSGQEPEDFELVCRKIATARAARLSYMTFDGEIDYEKDIQLHDILLNSKHMSPFEHCCRCMTNEEYPRFIKGQIYVENDGYTEIPEKVKGWCNNFRGFISYRYLAENETN